MSNGSSARLGFAQHRLFLGRSDYGSRRQRLEQQIVHACNRPVTVFLCHDKQREILSRRYSSLDVIIDCANKVPFTVDRSDVWGKEPDVCGSQGQRAPPEHAYAQISIHFLDIFAAMKPGSGLQLVKSASSANNIATEKPS